MRFDEAARVLEISVRELVEEEEVFHRVGFERSQAWRRLALGGEAHRRTQASRFDRFPGYRSEIFVSAEFATPRFRAVVSGRIDGAVETEAGTWLLEDYKTCAFDAEGRAIFPPERERRARRQLAAYCLLWERSGLGTSRGAVVLIDGVGRYEEKRTASFRAAETEELVLALLEAKFGRLEAERRERERKAVVAEALPFAFDAPRPIQTELMAAIAASVGAGRHLLAQAPTGSGKTAAALHAALAGAMRRGRRLVFLTAKTLQQNLVVETLGRMRPEAFRVLRMRAKEKICANDRVICHEEHCAFAFDYPGKMERSGILRRLLDRYPILTPDAVAAEARADVVCPFEVEIELASRVDVFVGDYNYVFEPVTALAPFAREELGECVLVVDEAHNLPDRARQIWSPELREEDVAVLENLAALSPGAVWKALGDALGELRALLASWGADLPEDAKIGEAHFPVDAWDDFLVRWDAAMVAYFEWKRESSEESEDDPVLSLHFQVVRFGLVLRFAAGKHDFARVVERATGGWRASLVCLDPSRALGPVLNAAASVVLLSATLEPFEVIRRLTGLDPDRTDTIALPPPFPRENRRVMLVPSVRTTWASRERNYEKIAEILARMADAHPGNDLALFPSYRFLREVAARLPPTRARVIEQRERLTELEKGEILRALETPTADGLLFLAVAGGMYAEGVDYPGEKLSGVFIVSPSLPQVSFERELLKRYFDDQEESGFEFAYIHPGMTRVIQAAGRLIRSETDRGVVALLCRRFTEDPYRRYLPRDWYDDDPAELVAADPERSVREFFAR
ncbi:MAG TPA: ATP-dependent DNA helicase [Thermoanaerobaculia bacterium]|nr:ATP-dependent DNA helicase [Thermoanaerobaculia bacterium]